MGKQSAVLVIALCSQIACSQHVTGKSTSSKSKGEGKLDIPIKVVNLSNGKQIPGLPNTNSIGYPAHGTSDGVILVDMYDGAKQSSDLIASDLYAISGDGKVVNVHRILPSNVKRVEARAVYAAESSIATLISAIPESKDGTREEQTFISLSKRDGTFEKLFPLDLKFRPLKIAVLDSGRYIVEGIDSLNRMPILALLDSDGSFVHSITLDNRQFDTSKSLGAIYKDPSFSSTELASASSAFVPYGSKVLFYVPGSTLPVHILGNGGEENAIQIRLPTGSLIETVLPTDHHDTWVVRTQSVQQFAQFQESGLISNPQQRLFEVDPMDGKVLKELSIAGVFPGDVISAAGKKLIAFHQIADLKDPSTPSVWVLEQNER